MPPTPGFPSFRCRGPYEDRQYHVERRPVLVVSGPGANSNGGWPTVPVAPVSSSRSLKTSFCVKLSAGEGRRLLDRVGSGAGNGHLAVGQQQRVATARALAMRPLRAVPSRTRAPALSGRLTATVRAGRRSDRRSAVLIGRASVRRGQSLCKNSIKPRRDLWCVSRPAWRAVDLTFG